MDYSISECSKGELIVLDSSRYGSQIWSEVKLRKDTKCCVTGEKLYSKEFAYRPITNTSNRMERISISGMEILQSIKDTE